MLTGVTGRLVSAGDDWVRLQVSGFVIHIAVPASVVYQVGSVGDTVSLHTYLRIREEQLSLYGFISSDDLETFVLLQGVSGIGPRSALGLLSALGSGGIKTAVETEDVVSLCAAPGIGKRTAGRIILDLKGKLDVDASAVVSQPGSIDQEVVDALIALGYSSSEARRRVTDAKLSEDMSIEESIRTVLLNIGGG